MKVILVDDEPLSLNLFKIECGSMAGFEVVGFFDNAADALEYVQANPIDFALLDIDMPEMSGIELANRLRALCPGMIVIFVTAHPEYAADAIHAKADFVVFKPYEREDIIDALERARLLSERRRKRIRFRTFGRFDMFVEGELVRFRSAKAKELLALCVSRMGGEVTIYEIKDVLWNAAGDQGLGYRSTIKALNDTLKEAGAQDIIRRKRSVISVDTSQFDCDLMDFKAGKESAINTFHGEFMQQYAWAQSIARSLQAERQATESFD